MCSLGTGSVLALKSNQPRAPNNRPWADVGKKGAYMSVPFWDELSQLELGDHTWIPVQWDRH